MNASEIETILALLMVLLMVKMMVNLNSLMTFLLSLEAFSLTVIFYLTNLPFTSSYIYFLLFAFSVCEACVGLGGLIGLIRVTGKDSLEAYIS